jgi:hypothetical protein
MKKLFFSAGIAVAASVAMATTISITGGTADVTGPGVGTATFSLFGTGVSFTGAGRTTSGPCNRLACTGTPGEVADAFISSEDQGLAGTVILSSITTNYLAFPNTRTGAGLDFSYFLPGFSTVGNPATVTLTTPFTALAFFDAPGFNGDQPLFMNGGGIATIALGLDSPGFPDGSPALYRLRSAHYEFVFVPEPGTAELILLGLIVWSAVAFGRRVIRGS